MNTFAAILAVGATNIQAQEADEEVYELSPFAIDVSDSQGYAATQTLAGTRLNTNLKDIASTITIVTKDFLEDTGSTNYRELLTFTPNTEVTGPLGNFSDEAGQTGENSMMERPVGINPATRVRGLAAATLTRNYFESNVPMDSYNTDRVTINRGANSILFGVGSPAGIVNTGTIAPIFADRNRFNFRFGSYGSHRASFDIERVLSEKFSIRLAGLLDSSKYQQRPAFEDDERLFGTMTYRPTESLSMNLSVEAGSIESNQPRQFAPVDYLSMWWDPLAHPDGTVKATHNAVEVEAFGPHAPYYFGPFGPIFVPKAIWSDPSSPDINPSLNARGTAAMLGLRHKNWTPTGGQDWWATLRGTGRNQRVWNNGVNAAIAGNFTNKVITDPSIYDYRNNLLDGDTKRLNRGFDASTFTIEQTFWDKNAGIEIAVDEQSSNDDRRELLSGGRSYTIMVDLTDVLPDGSANPNFGRPVTSFSSGLWRISGSESQTLRATGFLKLNFSDRTDGLLSKLVGNHALTGLAEEREEENFTYGGPQYSWGKDYAEFGIRDDNGKYVNPSLPRPSGWRSFGGMVYLGDSLANAASPSGANLQGHIPNLVIEDSYRISAYNYNTDQWEDREFSVEKDAVNVATKDGLERKSSALIFNSRFFDDHIVATYGWRKDTIDSLQEESPWTPDRYRLLDLPEFQVLDTPSGEQYSDTTFSWGVVGHVPENIVNNLGPVSSLSVHYASAENRVASGRVRHNIFGEELSSPLGETEEHGFTVGLFENRLSLRANWFRTVQSLRTETDLGALNGLIPFVLARSGGNAQAVVDENLYNQDDIAKLLDYPDFPQVIIDAWDIRDDGTGNDIDIWTTPDNLVSTSDAVSEGFELEAVGNVTRNWTVSFNASQQKVSRNNTGPAWYEFLYGEYNQAALWEYDAYGKFPSALGNVFNIQDRMTNLYLSPYNLARKQDGATSTDQVREWRWNLVTNYRFNNEGFMKGWTLGGGARWQDDIAIGYPQVFDTELDAYGPDTDNPIFGGSELTVDAFARYTRKILDDRVDWTIQLNIRNLLDDGLSIPVKANPADDGYGGIPIWRLGQERTWTLSSTFSF